MRGKIAGITIHLWKVQYRLLLLKKAVETTILYANKDSKEALLGADNSNANEEKRGFINVLQTERFVEGIRNAGYIDLSGKSDKEIKEEIEKKYGKMQCHDMMLRVKG